MTGSIRGTKALEKSEEFVFQLFIFGSAPASSTAQRTLELIRDKYLQGRCKAAVFDVEEDPQAAAAHEILATPTLVVSRGRETQRIVGSLDDPTRVLNVLGIPVEAGRNRGNDL